MTNYPPGTIGRELDDLSQRVAALPWWLGFRKWSFRRRIARVRQRMARMSEAAVQLLADERLRQFTQGWTEPEQRDVERLISNRKIVHCWEDGPRTEDDHGTTCMREDGHDGEHEWARDDQVTVRFSERRNAR